MSIGEWIKTARINGNAFVSFLIAQARKPLQYNCSTPAWHLKPSLIPPLKHISDHSAIV
jgi:hypothetical protein